MDRVLTCWIDGDVLWSTRKSMTNAEAEAANADLAYNGFSYFWEQVPTWARYVN